MSYSIFSVACSKHTKGGGEGDFHSYPIHTHPHPHLTAPDYPHGIYDHITNKKATTWFAFQDFGKNSVEK